MNTRTLDDLLPSFSPGDRSPTCHGYQFNFNDNQMYKVSLKVWHTDLDGDDRVEFSDFSSPSPRDGVSQETVGNGDGRDHTTYDDLGIYIHEEGQPNPDRLSKSVGGESLYYIPNRHGNNKVISVCAPYLNASLYIFSGSRRYHYSLIASPASCIASVETSYISIYQRWNRYPFFEMAWSENRPFPIRRL